MIVVINVANKSAKSRAHFLYYHYINSIVIVFSKI